MALVILLKGSWLVLGYMYMPKLEHCEYEHNQ